MIKKQNCWEFKKCGRQPGGPNEKELGFCRATTNFTYNGRNDGMGSGRYCWKVAGTLCDGELQGTYAEKIKTCLECDFYKMVKSEEGKSFKE